MTMNNRPLYRMLPLLAAGWCAVLLGGCNNDGSLPCTEGSEGMEEGAGQEVRLSLRDVRAVSGDTDVSISTAIGFFMKDPGTDNLTYTNVPGGYNNADGTWQPDIDPIWVDNRDTDIAVYAPYRSASNYDTQQLPLTAALRATDDGNGLLAAKFTTTNRKIAEGCDVTLSHVYARLVFTFVKSPGYTTDLVVNQCRLSGADIFSAATYDLFTETYTPGSGEPKKIDVTVNLTVPAAATPTPTGAQADLLVIPVRETFTGDALLEVYTTDKKHMKVVIPKGTFTASQPFAAGKQYNFTVKLSPSEIEIEGVSVNDWEDTTEQSGEVIFD